MADDHGHHSDDHDHGAVAPKDPNEQAALARDIGEELTEIFVRYVQGDVPFEDMTFLTFETLENLSIVASGEYELDYDEDQEYEIEEATEEQEDLAQEPVRDGD